MSVDVIPKSSKPLQGTTKDIQCSAGKIDSKYSWIRNGREIQDNDDRYSRQFFIFRCRCQVLLDRGKGK